MHRLYPRPWSEQICTGESDSLRSMYSDPAVGPSRPFWTLSGVFTPFAMVATGFPAAPGAAPALLPMQALPHSLFPCWRFSDPPIFTLGTHIPIHGLHHYLSIDSSQIPMTTQSSHLNSKATSTRASHRPPNTVRKEVRTFILKPKAQTQ